MAKVNSFRFSTKYQDEETDLLYYGHRFLNANLGKWISADPVGDKSFVKQHARSQLEARRLRKEGLKPGYLFVANNPISKFDVEGLRVACLITIRAAHLTSYEQDGNYEHFHSMDWRNIPAGDSYGYVGCGANTLNAGVAAQNLCAAVPGMPRNNSSDDPPSAELKRFMNRYGIPEDDTNGQTDIPLYLDSALEAAKILARARCSSKTCGCCASVRIFISCPHRDTAAADGYGRPEDGHFRERGVPKCGKSTALDCKTGNFMMLR